VRLSDALPADLVHPAVVETIRRGHPDWVADGYICLPDLHRMRTEHVREILEIERGELTAAEHEVVRSLAENEILSRNLETEFEHEATLGERLADRVATIGGSWAFVVGFGIVVASWIALNAAAAERGFDRYPFILLNLVLSCLAAIQAPIIMMSQNRQEAKDRLRGEHDYTVNLKAELEIRHVIAKLDQLISHQWQRLLEIQEMQLEAIDDLLKERTQS
jgi:uncharacterized membrane protein